MHVTQYLASHYCVFQNRANGRTVLFLISSITSINTFARWYSVQCKHHFVTHWIAAPNKTDMSWSYTWNKYSFFLKVDFFDFVMYDIQHCFICRPSDSPVSEDAGIEPRTVATTALAVRRTITTRLDLIISILEWSTLSIIFLTVEQRVCKIMNKHTILLSSRYGVCTDQGVT